MKRPDHEYEARLAFFLHLRLVAKGCGNPIKARRHEMRAGVLVARLLRRLAPLVRQLARQLAGYARRAGLGAEDLEQEAFLCLLKAMRSYDPLRCRSVRAFVRRVLYNRFVGIGRRRAPEAVADVEPTLDRRHSEGARREEMRREVADVTGTILVGDPQRALKVALFRAYHFEGRTFQELADACGMPLTRVFWYVTQARESFRAAYLAGGDDGQEGLSRAA